MSEAPKVLLPVTGSEPKLATKEGLEAQVNNALKVNHDNVEAERSARQSADDSLWSDMSEQRARTGSIGRMPAIPVGNRELVPTALSFDLVAERGYWGDTGLPWLPSGAHDDLFGASLIEYSGGTLVVTEWSFDLRPLRAYDLDTGKVWPLDLEDAISPQLEVEIEAPDLLNLYIRQYGNVYVRWQLLFQEDSSINFAGWRIGNAHEVTRASAGSYIEVQEITFGGETDVALRFKQSVGGSNKPNFNGGMAHGNEEFVYARILINGVEIDTSETGVRQVERIELHQASDMFEVGDTTETTWEPKGDLVMKFYKHLQIDGTGWWRMRFYVEHIIGGFEADSTFFGMVCLGWGTRGYDSVSTAARWPRWQAEDVSIEGFTEMLDQSNHLKAWGSRYAGEVKVTEGWDAPGRNIRVDNRNDRRKLYPSFFNGEITDTETPWTGEIQFRVSIKEAD